MAAVGWAVEMRETLRPSNGDKAAFREWIKNYGKSENIN